MFPLYQASMCWALHKCMHDNSFPLPAECLKSVGFSIRNVVAVKGQSCKQLWSCKNGHIYIYISLWHGQAVTSAPTVKCWTTHVSHLQSCWLPAKPSAEVKQTHFFLQCLSNVTLSLSGTQLRGRTSTRFQSVHLTSPFEWRGKRLELSWAKAPCTWGLSACTGLWPLQLQMFALIWAEIGQL